MAPVSEGPTTASVPDRLVGAAVAMLAEQGPSAIKARAIAAACGLSTMAVYSHFGGMSELVRAVVDRGFDELDATFARVAAADDPVANLFAMAVACRHVARANPHLYDLMFGLSTRATYRPVADPDPSGRSAAFRRAYAHIDRTCRELVGSGRVAPTEPAVVAAQLWSFVHGYVSLELAEHFAEFDDPVAEVLVPLGVTFCVGLGDTRERAVASHDAGLRTYRDWLHG